jgi:hypothetical protein
MYRMDDSTGETVFALRNRSGTSQAREVLLEGFSEHGPLRVPMRREAVGWVARLAITPGWFFYRFCVDGRAKWDRGAGRMRAADGRPWSLAVIHSSLPRRSVRSAIA